jgi:hypothetical protein
MKNMHPLDETLRLLKRQAQLEEAIRRPGGIRILEERELVLLRSELEKVPIEVATIKDTAAKLRKAVNAMSPEDLQRLSLSLFTAH